MTKYIQIKDYIKNEDLKDYKHFVDQHEFKIKDKVDYFYGPYQRMHKIKTLPIIKNPENETEEGRAKSLETNATHTPYYIEFSLDKTDTPTPT